MPVISLVNEGKTVEIPQGTNLRKALLRNGISPYVGKDKFLNCFGNGLCGTCRVEVVDGKGVQTMTPMEEAALVGLAPFYGRQIPKNVRLSCRINVSNDMTIKTCPKIVIDWTLTKQRLALTSIWTLFGGTFTFVMIRLLIEIATGR